MSLFNFQFLFLIFNLTYNSGIYLGEAMRWIKHIYPDTYEVQVLYFQQLCNTNMYLDDEHVQKSLGSDSVCFVFCVRQGAAVVLDFQFFLLCNLQEGEELGPRVLAFLDCDKRQLALKFTGRGRGIEVAKTGKQTIQYIV